MSAKKVSGLITSTPIIPFGLPLLLLRLRRLRAREEMMGVDKIDDIRRLGKLGSWRHTRDRTRKSCVPEPESLP